MMKWTDEDRRIFEYPSIDGTSTLFADPLPIRHKLLAHTGGKIDELVDKYLLSHQAASEKTAGSPEEIHPGIFVEGSAAEEQLVEAVVYAFGLKPFDQKDGSGASSKYCLRLLDWYNEWREQKKTSGETTHDSSPVTDSLPEHLRSHTVRLSDLSGMPAD